MRKLHFDHALLPEGLTASVGIDMEGGDIVAVHAGAALAGRERVAGIALPGVANLHSHTFQRAMAGLAETGGPQHDNFWTWRQAMYRFLAVLEPDDVEAVAAYAMIEMLEGGFTALAEFHYLHNDRDGRPYADPAELALRIVAAAQETGIGLTLLPVLYTRGGFGGAPPTEGQRRFIMGVDAYLALVERCRSAVAPLADAAVGLAPHSLRAVTPDELRTILAATPAGPVHIHVAEQVKEVDDCLATSGRRPVQWLLELADVDERWCLVHATHLEAPEIAGIAAAGAVAGLCPITEANLGDGIFPGAEFLAAGGRFGVGTDSNVEISVPGELKQFEYGQRLARRARNVLAGGEGASTGLSLYRRAVAGGAAASGRRIGALAPGHRADIVVLDAAHPDLAAMPRNRVLDAYVFVAGKRAIDSVFVGGERVVAAGRHRARDVIEARYRRTLARLLA